VSISPELKEPIEQLKTAIESGLPTKIEAVYPGYDHDDDTKKYLRGILDRADSIHVKSITFGKSNVTGNTAELRYRMNIAIWANGSKVPTSEVASTWRADLVREGPHDPWKAHQLKRIGL
jgi:hypothetical protein